MRHPDARWVRIPIGLLCVVGGVFAFLPVLGLCAAVGLEPQHGRAGQDRIVRCRTVFVGWVAQSLGIEPRARETGRPTMTHDVHLSTTAEAVAEPFVPAHEDRPLSFGAALVGFVLTTGLMSTVMVLLSA